jgi:serine/threonine protein kinase
MQKQASKKVNGPPPPPTLDDCRLSLRKVASTANIDRLKKVRSAAEKSLSNYKDSLVEETDAESVQNYDLLKKIGAGSFGIVYLVRKKQSSNLFAMKQLSKSYILQNQLKKYAYSEREVLKSINHPFILHASSFFQDK